MVRPEQHSQNLRIRQPTPAAQDLPRRKFSRETCTRRWLERLRLSVPEEGTLVLTIHQEGVGQMRLSFRVTVRDEILISEVRSSSLERGLSEAGCRLEARLRHLMRPAEFPWQRRLRELFRKAS